MTDTIGVETAEKKQVIDITDEISAKLDGSKVKEGVCLVFALHTTCSVMLGEYETGLDTDFINMFKELQPKGPFHHAHEPDHAPSHLFSSLIGEQVLVPIKNGGLLLGTWQKVMLVEFDGPRHREIVIQTLKA